jgi:hypothetical protein
LDPGAFPVVQIKEIIPLIRKIKKFDTGYWSIEARSHFLGPFPNYSDNLTLREILSQLIKTASLSPVLTWLARLNFLKP